MLDVKGNAMTATMWQDNHSGRRRHKLMTKELGEKIPAIGANENAADHDAVLAPAKLFCPYNGWTWYITEWEAETGLCFGLVEGFETELGVFQPRRAGGGHRVRQRPRRGARPVLGAKDPGRDQGPGVEGGLAVGLPRQVREVSTKGEDHA